MTTSNLDLLTQINLDDLITSFGWQDRPWLADLLRRTLFSPPRAFARQMVAFDSAIPIHGLVEASRRSIRHFVDELGTPDWRRQVHDLLAGHFAEIVKPAAIEPNPKQPGSLDS